MADKFNLDGFSVDEDNTCTAIGGFVGDITNSVTTVSGTVNLAGDFDTTLVVLSTTPIVSGWLPRLGSVYHIYVTGSGGLTLASPMTFDGANDTAIIGSGDALIVANIGFNQLAIFSNEGVTFTSS